MQALYNEAMGAQVVAPVTAAETAKAEKVIVQLRKAAKKWLKFRTLNDEVAMGKRPSNVPAHAAKQSLIQSRDWAAEQRIAIQLHTILSEVMDAELPNPDVSTNPNAAVELARIVVGGRLPKERSSPNPQGLLPLLFVWPVVVIVGIVAFTMMQKTSGELELQAQIERQKYCKETNSCTDTGFWVKYGVVAIIGWILWDKTKLFDGIKKS